MPDNVPESYASVLCLKLMPDNAPESYAGVISLTVPESDASQCALMHEIMPDKTPEVSQLQPIAANVACVLQCLGQVFV
jgi:hypothetical protein